ncbi:MAG: hypothetical protein ABI665_20835 [Vicinamibacterales bacterium]
MAGLAESRRGRPLKFGRKAQLVTITLPDDVVQWLSSLDADIGWALVRLHERSTKASKARKIEVAGLVQLPGKRALILVRPEFFSNLKGVSVIPLSDGRAFLALEGNRGVADLELAVLDRLEAGGVRTTEREALGELRVRLKQWRQEGIRFESRAIIVAHSPASTAPRARTLSPIQSPFDDDGE